MDTTISINIAHLFSDSMNIYGDYGNVISLVTIAQALGIKVKVTNINNAKELDNLFSDNNHHLIFMGGGQDNNQLYVSNQILPYRDKIMEEVQNNMPMLLICGAYQIFGHSFLTNNQDSIDGLNILPIITKASLNRMVGNVIINSPDFGLCYGFENHSGETFLIDSVNGKEYKPLGQVLMGSGNNHKDKLEGLVYKNIIASYLHGPLLPKNPNISLYLLNAALNYKYKNKFNYILSDIKDSALLDKIDTARRIAHGLKH
jgi:CobQ-like glutamine amidotransferase family enzyme